MPWSFFSTSSSSSAFSAALIPSEALPSLILCYTRAHLRQRANASFKTKQTKTRGQSSRSHCYHSSIMKCHQDSEFIMEMKIPNYLFGKGPYDAAVEIAHFKSPLCPVLVFINSRSGGQLGSRLLKSYRVLLSPNQVFDLSKYKPDEVLRAFYCRLEKLKGIGDKVAKSILSNLRIIVAGGDGTAGWLLSVIGDMKFSCPPPVATVPLGTGNNLPFSFGWGRKNPGTDLESAKMFLHEVYRATPMTIDSWHVVMKMATPSPSLDPVKLPHSLHPFQRVSESDALHEAGTQVFRGGFWNYFSIGMDAQVAYEFHKKRQEHPEMFKNQLVNQGTYAMIGVTQGWFLASLIHPSSRNINQLGDVYIQRHDEPVWKKLKIARSIRSIVMLNLPSFSGGLDPWGIPNDEKCSERKLAAAYVNDGLIELVGFRDGWHGLGLLVPKGHGARLAQAHKVRIEFHKGFASEAYMRIDGEPWMQPLPTDDSVTVVEMTSLGQAKMLRTKKCIAECGPWDAQGGEDLNTLGEPVTTNAGMKRSGKAGLQSDSRDEIEVRRKFGAADTFRH